MDVCLAGRRTVGEPGVGRWTGASRREGRGGDPWAAWSRTTAGKGGGSDCRDGRVGEPGVGRLTVPLGATGVEELVGPRDREQLPGKGGRFDCRARSIARASSPIMLDRNRAPHKGGGPLFVAYGDVSGATPSGGVIDSLSRAPGRSDPPSLLAQFTGGEKTGCGDRGSRRRDERDRSRGVGGRRPGATRRPTAGDCATTADRTRLPDRESLAKRPGEGKIPATYEVRRGSSPSPRSAGRSRGAVARVREADRPTYRHSSPVARSRLRRPRVSPQG
jgi:hypothetical protein